MSRTHAREIAKRSINEAKNTMGSGWQHISRELREGLIHSRILYVILGQDENISCEARLGYLKELVAAADELLDKEYAR